MSTPYIGEIRAVGFTFTPQGWEPCNGQLLSINDNQALFTLIGTTYGGDGNNSFGVPNLNGRVVVGAQSGAAGSGLSSYPLGSAGGLEGVTLTTGQLPPHAHSYTGSLGGSTTGTLSDDPAGRRPGVAAAGSTYASTPQTGRNLAAGAVTATISPNNGGQPHSNIQPVLALNFIICTQGIYPPS